MLSHSYEATWYAYGKAWSETDPQKRLTILSLNVAPECRYADPASDVQGYEAFSACMADFQQLLPGASFVTTTFFSHHDHSLAHWNMLSVDATVLGTGISYGRYGPDGRLVQMTGFFDNSSQPE
jgi:hypothetical protein